MSPIHVRPARAQDIDTILGFIKALADFEKLGDQVRVDRALLERHMFGAHPKAEALIAERDGEPAGLAVFFHSFSTFEGRPGLYLEDLFVRPAARGQGIGRALLARLAQLAIERDCARLEWAVLDWNSPAIEFYRAIGARPMEEWITQRMEGDALRALAGAGAELFSSRQ